MLLLLLLYLSYATRVVVVYLYELKIDAAALHLQSVKFCCCRWNSRQNWWRKRWPNKAYTHTHTDTQRDTHTRIGACDLCVQCAAVETTRRHSWLRLCLLFSDCECVRLYVCVCVCWLAKSGQWTTLNFGAATATSLWPPGRASSSCCVSCVIVVVVVVLLMLQFKIFLAFTL